MNETTYYEVYRLSTLDNGEGTRWVLRKGNIGSLEEARRFVRDDAEIGFFSPNDFRILSTCRRFEPYIEPS